MNGVDVDAGDRPVAFRVLFVCTGNICRSPFAEILTRHLLTHRLGPWAAAEFGVASAGVHAVVGSQMHPDSRDELMPWGLDGIIAGRFAARQLRSSMLAEADLVLGASPRHRSAVVERAPVALARSFSLREFARLVAAIDRAELPADPVDRAFAMVEQARMLRGLVPVDPDGDRIPDPMGRAPAEHRKAALMIDSAVSTIVNVIAG